MQYIGVDTQEVLSTNLTGVCCSVPFLAPCFSLCILFSWLEYLPVCLVLAFIGLYMVQVSTCQILPSQFLYPCYAIESKPLLPPSLQSLVYCQYLVFSSCVMTLNWKDEKPLHFFQLFHLPAQSLRVSSTFIESLFWPCRSSHMDYEKGTVLVGWSTSPSHPRYGHLEDHISPTTSSGYNHLVSFEQKISDHCDMPVLSLFDPQDPPVSSTMSHHTISSHGCQTCSRV